MSWTNIDLTNVNPNVELVAVGEYTFKLGGAKYGDSDPNRIEVNATIATDGDFTGRKLYFSYPDPAKPKCDWSPRMLKRLEVALGVDALPQQDPVEYLNGAAGNIFAAPVNHRKGGINPATGDNYPDRAEIDIFKVRAAA